MSYMHIAMMMSAIFLARVLPKATCWAVGFGYAAIALLAQWKGV